MRTATLSSLAVAALFAAFGNAPAAILFDIAAAVFFTVEETT